MQESIFYNKEQLKIIRNYGFLHLTLFKYWVALFALIGSLIASFFMMTSWYFSSLYILGNKDTWAASQALAHYNDKLHQVASIPDLKATLLNGNFNASNWAIVAEETLLDYKGITLPRRTNISVATLETYVQWLSKERYSNEYMNWFFQNILVAPTKNNDTSINNPQLLSLWGSSLKDFFWLGCTTSKSKNSFICSSYIKAFLNRFYLYDLSSSTSEIATYFNALNLNSKYKRGMCDWLLMYGNLVNQIDSNLGDTFRGCGSDNYNDFVLLRDFLNLNKQLWIWFVDASAYNNRLLNEYKLFSLQQLIFKEISATSDVKSLIQSYISFLRDALTKEEGKRDVLLSQFAKSFAYWFNMNVLSPYFKDEKSKMDKEDRTSLNAEMLTVNYGDAVAWFKWIEEQSLYTHETAASTNQTTTETEQQPLKDIFVQSYLPINFNLYSVEEGEDPNVLIVTGLDLRTNYTITTKLRYENLQLSVVNISIETEKDVVNETLTDFINSTINASKSNYSLNQALALIFEYKDFASEPSDTISLCDQLKELYAGQMTTCEDSIIEIKTTDSKLDTKEQIIYTFYLTSGALAEVKVSNELLETQILNSLDLSNVDANSTFYMIKSIMSYKIEETDTWFGLKDYLTISEVIKKYLWEEAKIEPENGAVRVLFNAHWQNFSAIYDSVSHELNPISLVLTNRTIIVQWLKLVLNDANSREISNFLDDPIAELQKLNPALVERYFPDYGKKK